MMERRCPWTGREYFVVCVARSFLRDQFKWDPFGGNQTMQMYGKFEGSPLI